MKRTACCIPAGWASFQEQAVARSRLNLVAPPGNPTRLAYLALGLCGEAGEAVHALGGTNQAAFIFEAGDVAWYLAMTEAESGVPILWRTPSRTSLDRASRELMHAACAVAECAKRPVQGRDLPREALAVALSEAAASLLAVLRAGGGTIEQAMRANVEKNHRRFGAEGYSEEAQRTHDAALRTKAGA